MKLPFFSRSGAGPAETASDDAAERSLVAASGLFDPAFYLLKSPDVAAAGHDPLAHFCKDGWREGRRPNLYFDPAWYRATQDPEGTENPLVHYIRRGEAEGCRPVAAFDPVWFRRVADVPATRSALAHLMAHRRSEKRRCDDPSDLAAWDDRAAIVASATFDSNYYLIDNPDVREAGTDPILHFHAHGWREGRRPNLYFDPLWYAARHLAGRPAENPLAHYVRGGEAAACRPSCLFDPAWYRAAYDVPAGTLALAHFLAHRRSQRVAPNPHFDLGFYLGRYGDDIGPNRDPFAHLLRWGAARDLDPSPDFSSAAYRSTAMAAGERARQVPLVHYLDALTR